MTVAAPRAAHRTARLVAAVAGLLGAVLALLTPLLPVTQNTAVLTWPQGPELAPVTAPLIAYVPEALNIAVPCGAAAGLAADGDVLVSTAPEQAPEAEARGLMIRRLDGRLAVVVRGVEVLAAPMGRVLGPDCRTLEVSAGPAGVSAQFTGLTAGPGQAAPLRGERDGDLRPQIVGVFTDLTGPAPPGLLLTATVDTRFSSSPTALKSAAMALGLLLTVVALVALHRLDTAATPAGRRTRRWSPRPLDGVVAAVLVWWHLVGANTSDDGYILTMARVAPEAGYLANYYRWFGTPEAPFGWYYHLLGLWSQVSAAGVWVRLPTLLMAGATWWLISRVAIPRLGRSVAAGRAAAWTAAGLFLAVWLPFNNGLRPEPLIALGILATWCLVERAVATGRLLPVAGAAVTGALTLFSGPTGVAALGVLLVAVGPLAGLVRRRAMLFGFPSALAPLAAAATVVLIPIFADQTLAGVAGASALKRTVGPSLTWFDEHIRYARLFLTTPDGSVARRFAVLALILALAVVVVVMLRRGRIPGTAAGPVRRLTGTTAITFLALMATPTKWTHHFGVFAGLAGAVGALAAVAISPAVLRSARNRLAVVAALLFLTALSFASVNGWWYVSGFGVPWSDRMPQWRLGFTTVLLGAAVAVLLVAVLRYRRGGPGRPARGAAGYPLALAAWAMVVFQVASLTLGMVRQYPAWSVGRDNLRALTGHTCGLADDVLVERDPNAGRLDPIGVPAVSALGAGGAEGFGPNGIPGDVAADPVDEPFAGGTLEVEEDAGPGAGPPVTGPAGINGSRARLPFGLDPAATPVLGSWRPDPGLPATLRSAWYRLPDGAPGSAQPLVVSAAGRFGPGAVRIEWAAETGEPRGAVEPADVGPAPGWRNLRVPLSALPPEASRVRLVVPGTGPRDWVALTPPRIPVLDTLQQVVGSADPVLLDWMVGLAFPCQRPFGHADGVIEPPRWRILPGRADAETNSPVMDHFGGGPLGISELLFDAQTLPSYLRDDWARDWGALQRLTPYDPDAAVAQLRRGTAVRSGWWTPAPLRPA